MKSAFTFELNFRIMTYEDVTPIPAVQDIYIVDFMKEKDGYEDHWSDQERR